MKADDAQAMMIESLRVRRREFLAVLASVVGSGLCPAVRAAVSRDVSAVAFDPAAALFAQMGEDARLASAEVGEERMSRLVVGLAARVRRHLSHNA